MFISALIGLSVAQKRENLKVIIVIMMAVSIVEVPDSVGHIALWKSQ